MFETIVTLLIVGVIGGMFYLMIMSNSKKPQHPASTHHKPRPATREKRPSTKAESLKELKRNKRTWGVEIKTPGCMEAFKLAGKHFPIDTAPALPLPDCPAGDCTCTYSGLTEHRGQARRVNHERRNEVRFDAEHLDRRSHKDRRKNVDTWKDRDF